MLTVIDGISRVLQLFGDTSEEVKNRTDIQQGVRDFKVNVENVSNSNISINFNVNTVDNSYKW